MGRFKYLLKALPAFFVTNRQSIRPVFATFSTYNMASTHVTERDGKGTVTVSPKNEASQSGLVVICHGLGDNAESYADVAEMLAAKLPHLKFIMPTAPTQPVTMNMGMPMPSWYDIVGLDERANENCKGLPDSKARIEGILKTEHETTGLPYSRMVLAGFSQGGALSLFTGLQLEESLAGIVVMSGYLPAASQLRLKQPATPVWHGHGTQDPLVQFAMAQKTKERLVGMGVEDYTLESFPIPHSISPPELQKVLAFMAKVLPPDTSYNVQLKDPKDMSVKELKAAIRKAGLSTVGLMEKSEFIKLLTDFRAGL